MTRKSQLWVSSLLILTLLVLLRGWDPLPVRLVRDGYFDLLQRSLPRDRQDLPVRVVDIDEDSLAELGQWPWSRDKLAQLTDELWGLGARVIVFDVLFSEPDRLSPQRLVENPNYALNLPPQTIEQLSQSDTDRAFARAISKGPVVLGVAESAGAISQHESKAGFVLVGENPSDYLHRLSDVTPLAPGLFEAAKGIGAINLSPSDEDGAVRLAPLVWSGETGPVPVLALEALRLALGEDTYVLFGISNAPGLEAVGIGDFEIPTNEDGEFRIWFRPLEKEMFVSAGRVLNRSLSAEDADLIRDHVVFVGASAAALFDTRLTALGQSVPGVSIHAQMFEQFISNDFLIRNEIIAALELLAFIVIGMAATFALSRWNPVAAVLTAGGAAVAVAALSLYAFRYHGLLFDATFPVLGGFGSFSLLAIWRYVQSDRDRRAIREAFARYVSDNVLTEIERGGLNPSLGGEMRNISVLFSDIRGFTNLGQNMGAEELVQLLNRVFARLSDAVLSRDGTIDKYIGDSIMAFWNAPLANERHLQACCATALAIRGEISRFNDEQHQKGEEALSVMTGLATGAACVGNIGSQERVNYSAIGAPVNVASRLETATRNVGYDILLCPSAARMIEECGEGAVLWAGNLELKGFGNPIETYLLVGNGDLAKSQDFQQMKQLHDQAISELQQGRSGKEQIAHCLEHAARIEPGLVEFYGLLDQRRSDFTRRMEPLVRVE